MSCFLNRQFKPHSTSNTLKIKNEKILLIGSGFLSMIIGKMVLRSPQYQSGELQLEVIGNANKDFWETSGFKRYGSTDELTEQYKIIILELI